MAVTVGERNVMTSNEASRRGRRSNAGGTRTANTVRSGRLTPNLPDQAWIIVEQDWEHNDEYFVPRGANAHLTLFYSKSEAQTECQRLNDEFFARTWTTIFDEEIETYLEPDSYDPDSHLGPASAAGYQGPFRVQALHTPQQEATAMSNPVIHAERSAKKWGGSRE